MDFWKILDDSKEAPPSNVDPKALKEYQRRLKKDMFIIGPNLADNQLTHIKSCKGLVKAWKPSATFMRQKVRLTSSSFSASFSRVR